MLATGIISDDEVDIYGLLQGTKRCCQLVSVSSDSELKIFS